MGLKYNSDKFESCLNTFRGLYSNPAVDEYQGSVMIPLDFSLEMDGISGIIPNSAFEIPVSTLPKSYRTKKEESKVAFILHTIDHNFNNNKWTTKITGQTLNIRFDELTEAEKEAIKKAQTPAEVSIKTLLENIQNQATEIVTAYSKIGGGTTKKIKGTIYKNGAIPNDKLRPILNEAKYKGAIKSDGGRIRLFTDASIALDKLLAQAEKDNIKLKINSAYRTYQDQVNVRRLYPEDSAEPGRSNHGFGLAVDFSVLPFFQKINTSHPQYKWLAENASKFGFKRIASEAWHWEYQNIN